MPDASQIRAVYDRYIELASKGDVEGVVDLYAEDGTIEDPIGAPPHRGRDAIRKFYQGAAGSFVIERTGPTRVAGLEAATPFIVWLGPVGQRNALDVISTMTFDEDGKIRAMRAYWSIEDLRPESAAD